MVSIRTRLTAVETKTHYICVLMKDKWDGPKWNGKYAKKANLEGVSQFVALLYLHIDK